jgi:hypothetical protein
LAQETPTFKVTVSEKMQDYAVVPRFMWSVILPSVQRMAARGLRDVLNYLSNPCGNDPRIKCGIAFPVGGMGGGANKLFHIFGDPGHNLAGLVSTFGSEEAAYGAILQGTEAAVQQQGLTGVFQTTVKVGGETITVRGNVMDGVVKIGTAFK